MSSFERYVPSPIQYELDDAQLAEIAVFLRNGPYLPVLEKFLLDHQEIVREKNTVSDTDNILSEARAIHPESLCIKDVYGAMSIVTVYGKVTIFARNGMPMATTAHIREYSKAENIKKAAQIAGRKNFSGFKGEIYSCRDLGRLFGEKKIICLRGFDQDTRTFQSGKENCPNSLAGCTEVVLFTWEEYALSLLRQFNNKGVSQENLQVAEVRFNPFGNAPVIKYRFQTDNPWVEEEAEILPIDEEEIIQRDLTTQVIPCPRCAKDIVRKGINKVNIQSLSRHGKSGNIIDAEDIWSLWHLIQNGVLINYPKTKEAGPVSRTGFD